MDSNPAVSTQPGSNNPTEPFVEQLIEEKGYPDLTDEVRLELKKDLIQRLDDFLTARMIAALPDDDVLKFESMLKESKPEAEIQQFLSTQIPNFTDFLTNTLAEFKGIYLGTIPSPPNQS